MKTMKKIAVTAAVVISMITGSIMLHAEERDSAKEPEAKVTGSASVAFYNQYVFRGYEIGKSGLVIQPSLSASYKGFTVAFWGNMDTNQRNTQSAVFSNEGSKGWNETDLTLSYTYPIGKLALTGGYTYYNLKYAEETEELFITAALDMLTKPSLSIYQDINSYKGTYINLSFAHSFPLPKDITLDLGVSFGYEIGESDYWRTYDVVTADYRGSKYQGFHDGMVKAGFTIPVTKAFVIQPVVQYWFPLSKNANKTYGSDPVTGIKISYNYNGYVPYNLVYGVGFTYSF